MLAISGADDNAAGEVDGPECAALCRYGHEDAVACVALCVDQDLVVSAAQDGTMLFHALSHGR